MDYTVTAFNPANGQAQVAFSQAGAHIATFAVDIPIVNGAYLTGAALDAEIRLREPTYLVTRAAQIAGAGNASAIEGMVAQTIVPAPELPTLEQYKAGKAAAVDAYRAKVLAAGVMYLTNRFDSDQQSILNLNTVVNLITAGQALPHGFVWRSADNVDVPFTSTDIVSLLSIMVMTANRVYQSSWAVKALISAATTTEELAAIAWSEFGIGSGVYGLYGAKTIEGFTGGSLA